MEAKPHLDAATALCRGDSDNLAGPLNRLWGDWHARGGDREAARDAYQKAEAARRGRQTPIEQIAWRGSHSRSTEDFLRSDQLDRAWDGLLQWQQDFPGDKREGYLPLLLARYWSARGRHEHAITVANDLLCVAPDSPHADQLLYLLAQSEEKLGRIERAQASYRSLATTYPGSPLVSVAQQDVARLEAGRQSK
jgi:TolA-binding protein